MAMAQAKTGGNTGGSKGGPGGGKDQKAKPKDDKAAKLMQAALGTLGGHVDDMDKQLDTIKKITSQLGKDGTDEKAGKQLETAVKSLQKMLDSMTKASGSIGKTMGDA